MIKWAATIHVLKMREVVLKLRKKELAFYLTDKSLLMIEPLESLQSLILKLELKMMQAKPWPISIRNLRKK